MALKPSEQSTKAEPIKGGIHTERYILDYGPRLMKKDVALKNLEEWLGNGSKYVGAVLLKSPKEAPSTDDKSYITLIEVDVKAYTVNVDPRDEVTLFILGANRAEPITSSAKKDGRMVISERSRVIVGEVIESALAYILGDNGKEVMLSKLQIDYGFGLSQVIDYPGRFMELLDEVLQGGARFIEDRLIQELIERFPALTKSSTLKEAISTLVECDSDASS